MERSGKIFPAGSAIVAARVPSTASGGRVTWNRKLPRHHGGAGHLGIASGNRTWQAGKPTQNLGSIGQSPRNRGLSIAMVDSKRVFKLVTNQLRKHPD